MRLGACIISIKQLCPCVSPAQSKPLYVSCVKTMRQELSVTVAVKNGKGRGMNSPGVHRGGQRSTGEGMTEVICGRGIFYCPCACVFPARKKKKKEKCSSGIVQRLMAALPGLQFSKYADAIPFEFQHNRVVKNADSSDARLLFPFSYLSQAVSLRHIKSTHS